MNTPGLSPDPDFNSIVKTFANLFAGRTDAYGAVTGACIKEPVTLNHYALHLTGQISLGTYPLRADGSCRWAAVDIDQENSGAALAVVSSLSGMGLKQGVHVERSKSRGYHVFLLVSQWVPARILRRIMSTAISRAGLPPTTEIFPKQDSLEGMHYGNYLNLPYFGGGLPQGRRMMVDLASWEPIPLQKWINQVEVFPAEPLNSIIHNLPDESSPSRKHTDLNCSTLLLRSLQAGERRPTLVKLTGYLRYRGVSEGMALALLVPWAKQAFAEPLPPEEIEKHIRGIYRRYGSQSLGSHQVYEQLPANLQKEIGEIWQ
jgi:hypothetical protein